MRRLLVLLPLLAWGPMAYAAETEAPPWYQVELIVFENEDPAALGSESWPEDPGTPSLDGAVELAPEPAPMLEEAPPPGSQPAVITPLDQAATVEAPPGPGQPHAYELLPTEALQLDDVEQRLANARQYRPILHLAWRQQVPDTGAPVPVHVHEVPPLPPEAPTAVAPGAGENDTAPEAAAAELPVGEPPALGTPAAEASATEGAAAETPPAAPELPSVDGVVTVHRARYLHVDADLVLQREVPPEAAPDTAGAGMAAPADDSAADGTESMIAEAAPPFKAFRMRQSHRLDAGKLYYFDHPLFGMLVLVTPYEPPPPPAPLQVETQPSADAAGRNGGDATGTTTTEGAP